jgi:transcription elongation factor Elf1
MSDSPFDPWIDGAPNNVSAGAEEHVQCPNCCRLASVVDRRMGLLFYECELCGTRGATERHDAGEKRQG